MRKTLSCILICLPLLLHAQSEWEKPEASAANTPAKTTQANASKEAYRYEKYLGPVVPVKDGEVVWERSYENQRDASANYELMLDLLTRMTREEGQTKESCVSLVNKNERKVVCHFVEWLVFSSTMLALDRTEMTYALQCECHDGRVDVRIFRIRYHYEENRDGGQRFQAETWITDDYALNKKHTKLNRVSGKFRRCTVDRMEQVLQRIGEAVR